MSSVTNSLSTSIQGLREMPPSDPRHRSAVSQCHGNDANETKQLFSIGTYPSAIFDTCVNYRHSQRDARVDSMWTVLEARSGQ